MSMSDKYSDPQHIPGLITSVLGVLSLDQWAVLIGIVCTIGTFLSIGITDGKSFR